ncbi:AbiV family abortive infection protein [Demequina sp. SYSU T00068]|uniref:AbiV family abortive infection protein n=1 Tax=Demequina lignilytica TaxID=3051663 RepID=UPI002623579B|nr:AbiV family abortive infection protein [Demequina sp. SYSU T00068]MDN4490390.1 AbiV family abortive infection protein [Demequina sp. SYSU T00068]
MTRITPESARALWLALVENAARLVTEADLLYPSPRAQSLSVLAREEIGKAVWVQRAFWKAWETGDETPRDVPELREHGRHHVPKLVEATSFLTDPEFYSPEEPTPEMWAHADNIAKQQGFYVELHADGTITAPADVERPALQYDIWEAAALVQWAVHEDRLLARVCGLPTPPTEHIEALVTPIVDRDHAARPQGASPVRHAAKVTD